MGVSILTENGRILHVQECSAKLNEGIWEGISFIGDIFDGEKKVTKKDEAELTTKSTN